MSSRVGKVKLEREGGKATQAWGTSAGDKTSSRKLPGGRCLAEPGSQPVKECWLGLVF